MRLLSLDVLRGVAVLLVLVRHLGEGKANTGLNSLLEYVHQCPNEWAHWPALLFRVAHRCGWMGVDLFFVLSGFLVSGLLFREYQRHGRIWLGRFLIRRGFKIYPAFYVFLALAVAGIALTTSRPLTLTSMSCEALFVQNYGPNIWGHTWSLAVEEHFYLMLGVLLLALSARRCSNPFAILPRLFVGIAVVEFLLRVATAVAEPEFNHKIHVFPTHLRVDSLFLGVVLSYYYHLEPEQFAFVRRSPRLLIAASLLLIAPALVLPQRDIFMRTAGLTMLAFGFGGIVLAVLPASMTTERHPGRAASLLAAVGFHSYSIYLWHLPVLVVGVPVVAGVAGSLGTAGEFGVYLFGSIGLGIAMAKLIEWPALRLRDRCFPSRSSSMDALVPSSGPVSEPASSVAARPLTCAAP